jgi:Ca2+-binding RTX toxin-like protein
VLIDAPSAATYTIHVGRTGPSFTQEYSVLASGFVEGRGTPPTDLKIFPNFVLENEPVGTPVGQFSAIDPDADDLSFTYRLVDGNGDNDNRFFNIQGNQLATSAVLDYEAAGRSPAYSIVVRVTDQHGDSLDKRMTIFVENVNEPPGSLRLDLSRIDENQPAGTTVGTFSATDPEKDTKLTYSLLSSIGGPDTASFSIDGSRLKTKAPFDYETQRSYTIYVRVADSAGAFSDWTAVISINDVNEAPTAVDHRYSTSQNTELTVAAPGLLEGAADPENVRFEARLVADSAPEHGTVSVRPDGSFVYQPDQNYVGSDEFTYQVFDGRYYSDPARVSIDVGYGPGPVVQAPTVVVGGNKLVLALAGGNLRLINFTNRQVVFDEPVSTLTSLTILGADNRDDSLTIDPSVNTASVLPEGVIFDGGRGHLADTLVLRGSSAGDEFAVAADFASVNSLVLGLSNVEQLVLEGGGGDDTYQISALPINTTISESTGNDWLDFSSAASGVRIDLGRNSAQAVFGAGGTLTIKGTIENVRGTDLADSIQGNSANNVLVGGDGDDRLDGGAGRDLLIGGAGSDTLRGGSGDDILIGGTTDHDNNTSALAAIMREWTSARPYQKRRANLATGLLVRGTTVLDDAARDDLFGGQGQDWFLDFFPFDVAHDRERNER